MRENHTKCMTLDRPAQESKFADDYNLRKTGTKLADLESNMQKT